MDRDHFLRCVQDGLRTHPVAAVLGPRQCGKTTLARMYAEQLGGDTVTGFDLEDPTDLGRLGDPKLALQDLRGLVVIDEIQRMPGLFEILRVLVDREQSPARFLILGSASPDLIRQSSETLAGRIQYLELTPFQMPETGTANATPLWVRGGFPRSYLAESDADSMAWRRSFLTTFLERDVPNLGIRIPAQTLRRLWMMLAHNHGQVLNSSGLGSSLGITNKTVKHYLHVLYGTYMIRLLPPWHENIAKRQVKSPKVYFRDSGILHSFLGLENYEALLAHPKLGASWEGFALEEVIRASGADEQEIFFWATHQKAELDLLFVRGMDRTGYEITYTSAPRLTKSMKIAIEDLKLKHLDVVFPGEESFPLASNVRAVGLRALIAELRP